MRFPRGRLGDCHLATVPQGVAGDRLPCGGAGQRGGQGTLLRVRELMRQQTMLSVRHAVAIHVYTYELSYEGSDKNYDQIYSALSRAMRLHKAADISFWGPLIWEVDCTLQALPSFCGKLYGGINCRFDPKLYPPPPLALTRACPNTETPCFRTFGPFF